MTARRLALSALIAAALLSLAPAAGSARGAAAKPGAATGDARAAAEEADSVRTAFHPDVVTRRSGATAAARILPPGPIVETPTYVYTGGNPRQYETLYLTFMDELPVRLQVLDNAVATGNAQALMEQFDEIGDYADQLELKWLLAVADSGAEAASRKDGPTVHLRCLELLDYIGRVDVRLPGRGSSPSGAARRARGRVR